jgi:hypothetical protein
MFSHTKDSKVLWLFDDDVSVWDFIAPKGYEWWIKKHLERSGSELNKVLHRYYFKLNKPTINSVSEGDVRTEIQTWYLSHESLLYYRYIRLAYKIQLDICLFAFAKKEFTLSGWHFVRTHWPFDKAWRPAYFHFAVKKRSLQNTYSALTVVYDLMI